MTEYERIAKKHGWPLELHDEVKCDFLVTSKLRKVQLIELDLLLEFDKLCRNNGLEYFLIGGTLLGAVRHKGFIPWDDDIDVCMPRDDYNQLCKIGAKNFDVPYFFQSPYTDTQYSYSHCRLRNSNTTAITPPFRYCDHNQGIWIDILPLDKMISAEEENRRAVIFEKVMNGSCAMRRNNSYLSDDDKQKMKKFYISDLETIENYEAIQSMAAKFENESTEHVGLVATTVYPVVKQMWREEDFNCGIEMEFENFRFCGPKGYESCLKTTFGDYMKYPKVSERGICHSVIFAPDISYKEWLKLHIEE